MNATDLAGILDVLTDRAGALRSAGVRELQIGEVRVLLDAPEPAFNADAGESPQAAELDALNDPATYGRLSGVPGYTRDEEEQR